MEALRDKRKNSVNLGMGATDLSDKATDSWSKVGEAQCQAGLRGKSLKPHCVIHNH